MTDPVVDKVVRKLYGEEPQVKTWEVTEDGLLFHEGRLIGRIVAESAWSTSRRFTVHGVEVEPVDWRKTPTEWRSISAAGTEKWSAARVAQEEQRLAGTEVGS